MTLSHTITLTLPQTWMPALINLDVSGYDAEELDQLELFTYYMRKTYGTAIPLTCDENSYFQKYHDAQHLFEDLHLTLFEVVDVVFPITKQEEV